MKQTHTPILNKTSKKANSRKKLALLVDIRRHIIKLVMMIRRDLREDLKSLRKSNIKSRKRLKKMSKILMRSLLLYRKNKERRNQSPTNNNPIIISNRSLIIIIIKNNHIRLRKKLNLNRKTLRLKKLKSLLKKKRSQELMQC